MTSDTKNSNYSSKRIGILVYGLDRPLTGISRYTLELVRAMETFTPRPNIYLLAAGSVGPLEKTTTFPVISLPFCRLLPALMTVGQWFLRRVVKKHRLEVVHDLTGISPFGLLPQKTKKIITLHDVFALSIPGYSSVLDTLIYKWWLPWILPQIQQVITPSQHSKQDIARLLNVSEKKITIISQGVHSNFRPLSFKKVKETIKEEFQINYPYILFVGHWTERKNLSRALAAFASISSTFPNLKMVLVGPSIWKKSPVATLIKQFDIEENVQLLGYVSEEKLPLLYNGASLFLFPSLYEGFGLPVLEAMACGTPVVTSNCSALPEVAGKDAVLINPNEVEEIANAMQTLLDHPKLMDQYKKAGLARSKHFSWERCAQATISVYEN